PVVPAPAERDITSAAVSTPIGSASTGLASPAVPSPVVAQASDLPDLGPAPAVVSDHWLNVEAPLDWTALDGTVRVVEFWTFGCINCINDIPAVRGWHDAYGNRDDFRIVSVHYPEFAREHDLDAVAASLERLHVPYAVAIDNDGVNWRAWRQRAWPTRYVVDRHGRIRFTHVGEGAYDQTTHAIEALLAER
ncbi:MAG: hypothetical protein ABI780_09295, partial [Ardenticatenales bacterium]